MNVAMIKTLEVARFSRGTHDSFHLYKRVYSPRAAIRCVRLPVTLGTGGCRRYDPSDNS
jgi:hypothetical protein